MEMKKTNGFEKLIILQFCLDEMSCGLDLHTVERVERAVEITPLPKAPEIVKGIINFHGEIIAVINMRKRFNLPEREMEPEDLLIIARTSKRLVGLVVDKVFGVQELEPDQFIDAEVAFPYTGYISGIARVENSIVMIHDLEKFLSLDEQRVLNKAIIKEEKKMI